MLHRRLVLASLILSVAPALPARPGEFAIPVSVAEPASVERQAAPASGGVPFKKGQVKSIEELALFTKDGKALPAQFSKLAPYEDGSVQWALLDTLLDLPAGGKLELLVKPGKPAAPARALDVKDSEALAVVDTGAAKFTVNKASFSLLEAVEVGGKKIAGPGGLEITNSEGKTFKAGKPTKVSWEYRGPVRSTLRVDGDYLGEGGAAFLAYTARLTFWAGSSTVRVEHAVRNSNPEQGDDAKIKEASLSLTLATPGAEAGKGAGWLATGDGQTSVLIVCRHTGGCFPGGKNAAQKLEVSGGKVSVWVVPPGIKGPGCGDGFFALADRAHKDTEVWFDFASGARDAAAAEKRRRALVSKLHALTDGAWISETETMGSGHFGTLADEIETYKKWGWKGWDNAKKLPRSPHKPDAYVASEAIHDESEADCAEGLLLMYVRTGERGFLDDGEAWARYYKTHYAYRTDGFDFAKARTNKGLKFGWYSPKEYGWGDTRSDKCHFYGRGIFDYYCLTGDVDALEGGRDLLEEAAAYKIGGSLGTYGIRWFARMWLTPIRAAQLSADPKDRAVADRFAEACFKAPDWDERGFVRWGAGPAYMVAQKGWLTPNDIPPRVKEYMEKEGRALSNKGEVVCKDGVKWSIQADGGTWQQASLAMSLERYWRMSGSEEAKKLALKMAGFARDYQISKKARQAFYYTILDFPDKGKVFDRAEWSDGPVKGGGGHYTRFFPDVFARAYSMTGDKQWLEEAKSAWDFGSGRNSPEKPAAADGELAIFAYHRPPKDDCALTTCRMFYEVPRAK